MKVHIASSARVFVLDDTDSRISWFRARLPNMSYAKTSEAALEILSQEKFDMVFLDHDLHWMDAGFPERQHGNGKEVARFLAIRKFSGKIVIHSHADAAAVMHKILPQAVRCRFDQLEITQDAPPAPKYFSQSRQAAAR